MHEFYGQLARESGAELFDLASRLCNENLCRIANPEVRSSLYFNADHLSLSGIAFAGKALIDDIYR